MVVNIMGDAAIGMSGMDIETGVRHQIPILTIVLNNHVLSGYSRNYPVATDSFAFTNLYGDYASLAQSLGAEQELATFGAEIKGMFLAGRYEEVRTLLDQAELRLLERQQRSLGK